MLCFFRSSILVIALFLCINSLQGREYQVCELKYDKQTMNLKLVTDDYDRVIEYFLVRDSEEEIVLKVPAKSILSEIVLFKYKRYDIVKLRSSNFNLSTGGRITVDYLYNGITGSRKNMTLDLNDYFEFIKDGYVVYSLRIIEKKVLGQTVGIKRIILNG